MLHEPGTHYAYWNFGYCVLGRVIEKVTGWSYPEYVKRSVLAKCGILDMRVSGNTLRDPGEVLYYSQEGGSAYSINVSRMDSHGGWIATPTDLVRFAMHVDGLNTTQNILSPASIKTMTTPTMANPHYACGWNVNTVPNWWHTGGMQGTTTLLVRTASGLCWSAFTNTNRAGLDLDGMMWQMVKAVPAWQA
jgi:CubicO group peptidase (beta-lactamase class C family)